MGKIVKAQAKNNCTVHYSDVPFGLTNDKMKKHLIKGQVLQLEIVTTEKIVDRTIASILGDKHVILRDGGFFVSTYSNDFIYN